MSVIHQKNLAISTITTSKSFIIGQLTSEKSGVSNIPRTFGHPVVHLGLYLKVFIRNKYTRKTTEILYVQILRVFDIKKLP